MKPCKKFPPSSVQRGDVFIRHAQGVEGSSSSKMTMERSLSPDFTPDSEWSIIRVNLRISLRELGRNS
jgi:hypothetical protein